MLVKHPYAPSWRTRGRRTPFRRRLWLCAQVIGLCALLAAGFEYAVESGWMVPGFLP